MYGMTHVVAIDGYSRKIVGFLSVSGAQLIYACETSPGSAISAIVESWQETLSGQVAFLPIYTGIPHAYV